MQNNQSGLPYYSSGPLLLFFYALAIAANDQLAEVVVPVKYPWQNAEE